MAAIMRKEEAAAEYVGSLIDVLPAHQPANAPTGGEARLVSYQGRGGANCIGIPRQARIAVRPMLLQGDPVGAEISLLEHMDVDSARPGHFDRDLVVMTAISEEQDVGDVPLMQECSDEAPPLLETPAKIDAVEAPPEESVARAEIDSVNGMAMSRNFLPEAIEEGGRKLTGVMKRVAS
jgi:hypothetical protein